jgi:hypothetical protein
MSSTLTPLDQLRAEFANRPAWVVAIERENDELERQRTQGDIAPTARPQFDEARKRADRERHEKLHPDY